MSAWGGRQAQRLLTLLLSTRPHLCVMPVCLHPAGRVIDARLRGTPSKWRPSVEHKRARSQHGTDDPANLGLAHLACNSARGNRVSRRPAQVDAAFFTAGAQDTPPTTSCSPR